MAGSASWKLTAAGQPARDWSRTHLFSVASTWRGRLKNEEVLVLVTVPFLFFFKSCLQSHHSSGHTDGEHMKQAGRSKLHRHHAPNGGPPRDLTHLRHGSKWEWSFLLLPLLIWNQWRRKRSWFAFELPPDSWEETGSAASCGALCEIRDSRGRKEGPWGSDYKRV